MNPFFFGDSTRQLFGVYHPSRSHSTRGVVLCYPWGREYLLAHPTLRLLAQRLSDAGWHVLRFDYLGTGDSAGDVTDASEAQWLQDISTAIDELRDVANVTGEVALVGLRYGATLAALGSQSRREARRLVLWDPVSDGRKYLTEMGVPDTSGDADVEIQGAILTPRLRAEIEQVNPDRFVGPLPQTLVVATGDAPNGTEQLVGRLQSSGVSCVLEHAPDVQVWREEWGRGGKGLAATAINRIVTWLQ